MRKSTVILTSGLWLLALLDMWLVLQLVEEHARAAESRTHTGLWKDLPQSGYSIIIVNAPPDIDTRTSGPSTRTTPVVRKLEPGLR
jgi:hypothetical protein